MRTQAGAVAAPMIDERWSAHGDYDISVEGQVLSTVIRYSWNAEGMRQFSAEFRARAEPLCQQPWASLSDLRAWTLTTPDADDAIAELEHWCIENNQRWRALIMPPSVLAEHSIDRYTEPSRGRIEQRLFAEPESAWAWMRELGLL